MERDRHGVRAESKHSFDAFDSIIPWKKKLLCRKSEHTVSKWKIEPVTIPGPPIDTFTVERNAQTDYSCLNLYFQMQAAVDVVKEMADSFGGPGAWGKISRIKKIVYWKFRKYEAINTYRHAGHYNGWRSRQNDRAVSLRNQGTVRMKSRFTFALSKLLQ